MSKRQRSKISLESYLILPLALLFAGAGSGYYIHAHETSSSSHFAETNTPKAVYAALYSDQVITDTAKVSEPHLAASVSIPRPNLAANVLEAVFSEPKHALQVFADAHPERGTWLWTPIMQITPDYRDQIIAGAQRDNIRTIYLSIDSYLDIFTLPEGDEKEGRLQAFDAIILDFIEHANAAGITVDAEGGWRNWSEKGHEYKAFAILDYAIRFNEMYPQGFRGVQFDIEPYLLDEFHTEKRSVLRRFVSLIEASVFRLNNSGSTLQLSVVIPEFYDGGYSQTPRYFHGLRYGYAIDHLLHALEHRPESKIIVMAYRNYAEGTDGALHISEGELEAARRFSTKIIIAQEVGDVPPPYITFHATSRERLESQVATIEETLGDDPSFGGISYHFVNALLDLR